MQRVDSKLIWLGYGCAVLSLFFGGNAVEVPIALGLGAIGLVIGVIAASRGRPLNGVAVIIISVIFAYLGATGFRQGVVEGFEQGYQSARERNQGQMQP